MEPPAVISSELIKGNYEIALLEIEESTDLAKLTATPLLIISNKQMRPFGSLEEDEQSPKIGDTLILYQRKAIEVAKKDIQANRLAHLGKSAAQSNTN